MFHSDRGCQYTALAFSQRCAKAGIQRSMGRVGSCFDSAMAESLFATVECELLQRTPFESREQVQGEIFKFLEGFYNRRRRHSALGYLSPVEFERAWSAPPPPGPAAPPLRRPAPGLPLVALQPLQPLSPLPPS